MDFLRWYLPSALIVYAVLDLIELAFKAAS